MMKNFFATVLALVMIVTPYCVMGSSADTANLSATVSSEATPENLALGASYTVSGDGKGYGVYTAGLTDGQATDSLEIFNDNWFSFYYDYNNYSNHDAYNTENACGTVIIDLGSMAELSSVRLHLANINQYAVIPPAKATLSVSDDNKNFLQVGDFTIKQLGIAANESIAYWTDFDFNDMSARYVKIDLHIGGYHTFINEIEVYGVSLPAEYTIGDINSDGKINISDYILAKRTVLRTYTPAMSETADITGEGTVNISDCILIKRSILKTYNLPKAPHIKKGYEDIPAFDSQGLVTEYFALEGGSKYLSFDVPMEWEFQKDADGNFAVTRQNNEIGRLVSGAVSEEGYETVNIRSINFNAIDICEKIEKRTDGDIVTFRYNYSYSYAENSENKIISLVVDYDELSKENAVALMNNVFIKNMGASAATGTNLLSDIGTGPLLIIGNSFINSSRIGGLLNEMLDNNNKTIEVNAISRGYASVSTYVADAEIMADLRAGTYEAVFVCGFYANGEVDALATLVSAAEAGGTEVVLFPAHNESQSVINIAKNRFPQLRIIDWKGEIDALIESGIDKWSFCVNDAHLHSTYTAGYVGAHQIYRAIYGEVPAVGMSSAIIGQSDLDSTLGSYGATGIVGYIDPESINYIG